jgi:hypothetical protein
MGLSGQIPDHAGDLIGVAVIDHQFLADHVGPVKVFFGGLFSDHHGMGIPQSGGCVAVDHGQGKHREETGIRIDSMLFLDILAAFFHPDVPGSCEPDHLFDLGEIVFQGKGSRCRRSGIDTLITPELDLIVDPVDAVGLLIVPVIAQLVQYIKYDEQAGSDA